MKKLFYFIFVTISLAAVVYSCSNEEKSDLEKAGLVGNVKSITTVSYDAYDKFGEGNVQKVKPNNAMVYISSFDSLGNILMEKSLIISDVKRCLTTVTNNQNQRIKRICYDYDDDSKMQYGTNYYYDDKGNLLKEHDFHNNKTTTYNNTYDSEGHLVSQIGGSCKKYWDYSNGALCKYTECFLHSKDEYFFKDGKVQKETLSYGTSPGIDRIPTYDEQGREIEVVVIENDNISSKIKTVYLTPTDVAPAEKIVWDADGAIVNDYTYTYFIVGKDTVTIFNYYKEILDIIEFYLKEPNGITKDTYTSTSSLLTGYQYIYENGVLVLRRDLDKGIENKYVDGIMTIIEENDNEVTECKYKRNALISRIIKDKNGQIKYSYVVDGSDSKKTITIIDKGETKKGEEVYENGKLVKFIDATNGLTSSVTYDKDGHMSEIKNSDGTVWSFKYDFDEKGNWVREIKYKNGKADRITERSILYY